MDFINASSEGERDYLARQLMYYALIPHAKGHEGAAFGDLLNTTELFSKYEFEKNRKHLSHSVNTFLLGLLFYHNLPSLKESIDEEMRETTNRLSDGDVYGEFLFRWRLASLMHDLGNGISLFKNNADKIHKYLFNIMIRLNAHWSDYKLSVNDLLKLSGSGKENTLQKLDKIDNSDKFQNFFKKLEKKPYKKIYYDHGIVSALIILKALYELYEKHNWKTIKIDGNLVSFDREFFDNSVTRAAYAVAMHNLDFYPEKYTSEWQDKLYNANKQSFVFLLKLADTLQEWHKAKAMDQADYIEPDKIFLRFENGSIVFEKYPKLKELKKKVGKFFNSGNLLKLPDGKTI